MNDEEAPGVPEMEFLTQYSLFSGVASLCNKHLLESALSRCDLAAVYIKRNYTVEIFIKYFWSENVSGTIILH